MLRLQTPKRPAFRTLSCVAAAATLAFPPSAAAALGLTFATAIAAPGETVQAFSPHPWNAAPAQTRVYLIPLSLKAAQPAADGSVHVGPPPRNPSIVYLGQMQRRRDGILAIRFRVPHVRPGLYTTAFWCIPCYPPTGSFIATVLSSTPWTRKPGPVLRIISRR